MNSLLKLKLEDKRSWFWSGGHRAHKMTEPGAVVAGGWCSSQKHRPKHCYLIRFQQQLLFFFWGGGWKEGRWRTDERDYLRTEPNRQPFLVLFNSPSAGNRVRQDVGLCSFDSAPCPADSKMCLSHRGSSDCSSSDESLSCFH